MMVLGILGDERVSRSKSPLMHNAVMRRRSIHGVYVPFPVKSEDVGAALQGIRALGIVGANVTVPHKEAVLPFLDGLSHEASLAGAVNTLVRREDRLEGHNTDIHGFVEAISGVGLTAAGASVLLLGAGGAARAALVGLSRLGVAEIWVASRDLQRAARVAGPFGARALPLEQVQEAASSARILINATSVSSPQDGPELARLLEPLRLPRCTLVVDLNYGREENLWERLAAASGARFVDGIPMLVHQAARSFALWTEIEVSPDEYLAALEAGPAQGI